MEIGIPVVLPDAHRNLDANELYRLVQKFFQHHVRKVDPVAMVALDEWEDKDNGEVVREKVRYELREGQLPFSENGLVGHCTARQFLGIVHYSFDDLLSKLKKEQPGCSWALVAVKVERVNIAQTVEIAFSGEQFSIEDIGRFVRSPEAVAIERKSSSIQVPDYRCVCTLVFADLARGQLRDPATYHPRGLPGPMTTYARTRLLRDLTDSQRDTRASLEGLLTWFYGQQQQIANPLQHTTVEPDVRDDEIAELRRRIAEMEDRALAPPTPQQEQRTKDEAARKPRQPRKPSDAAPAPMEVPIPTVTTVAEELSGQIVEMRTSGQMTPKAISKALEGRVTEDEVKAVLRSKLP